jgi:PHP family Zn ribbon phosphoesterase
MKLLAELGSEFTILLDTPLADIEKYGSSLLAEGLHKMREGRVHVTGGYDGEFGVIKVFDEKERRAMEKNLT